MYLSIFILNLRKRRCLVSKDFYFDIGGQSYVKRWGMRVIYFIML